jgi:hypothetical protein
MGHEHDNPPTGRERVRCRGKRSVEWLDVLDAQKKRDGVERLGLDRIRLRKPGYVTKDERTLAAVMSPSEREQLRARIDTDVLRTGACDVRCQHAGSAPEIENPFASADFEKREQRRNRELAVVVAAVRPDPARVPGGNRIPTAA